MLYSQKNRRDVMMCEIKRYREMANLTQEQLGIAAGLSGQAAISNYELGNRVPKFKHLIAIKNVFIEKGVIVTLEDLVSKNDQK